MHPSIHPPCFFAEDFFWCATEATTNSLPEGQSVPSQPAIDCKKQLQEEINQQVIAIGDSIHRNLPVLKGGDTPVEVARMKCPIQVSKLNSEISCERLQQEIYEMLRNMGDREHVCLESRVIPTFKKDQGQLVVYAQSCNAESSFKYYSASNKKRI